MAEYNVQINKYNATEAGYDQLYPEPMNHGTTHLPSGTDPIGLTAGNVGAYTKAEVDTALQAKPNPNLLDNWYFANPVNQRGQTEYPNSEYGIDRWVGLAGTVVTSDGIKFFDEDSGNRLFEQRFERSYDGVQMTASVLLSDNRLLSLSGTFPFGGYVDRVAIVVGNLGSPSNLPGFRIWDTGKILTVPILAVKLELGDQQTLAHQDSNGNWVLNEIPDYGEQLAKCQRYFYNPLSGGSDPDKAQVFLGIGVARSTTEVDINIPLPCSMRIPPTITASGLEVFDGVIGLVVQTLAVRLPGRATNNANLSVIVTTSGATIGSVYELFTNALTAVFMLDANL